MTVMNHSEACSLCHTNVCEHTVAAAEKAVLDIFENAGQREKEERVRTARNELCEVLETLMAAKRTLKEAEKKVALAHARLKIAVGACLRDSGKPPDPAPRYDEVYEEGLKAFTDHDDLTP